MRNNITSNMSGPSSLDRIGNFDHTQARSNRAPIPLASIQSTRDLKMAENNGQTFSIGETQLIKVIEKANKALQGHNTSFEFSIHEGTKEIMVKVLDKDTGEIIREIPSEKILDLVAKLWEASGIFVDERR